MPERQAFPHITAAEPQKRVYDKLQLVVGRLRSERRAEFRAGARRKMKFAVPRQREALL